MLHLGAVVITPGIFLHLLWCAREDLNLQPLRDQILSLARLPFRHARFSKNMPVSTVNLKQEPSEVQLRQPPVGPLPQPGGQVFSAPNVSHRLPLTH